MLLPLWHIVRAKRSSQLTKQTIRSRLRRKFYRPQLELFEDRVVLSTIHWINPSDGNWEVGSNWSGGVVPGPSDDVVIDVPGNITITHGIGNDTVQSLTSQQNLTITNGSSLTVTGTFSEVGNRLLDVDLGSAFTGNGPSTVDGASLYALHGSTVHLAGATSYNASGDNFSPLLEAEDAGSLLDLSGVTNWQGSGSSNNGNLINVAAGNGAVVNLSQVSQITAGNTQFQASAGGQINLSALTTFSGAAPGGYNVLKAASEAANIVAPNLTSLTNVDLDLFGNATLPVAALTTFTNGNAYAYNDGLAGGVLTLPLTTINYAGANFSPLFQAEGAGSLLDLSSVTSWAGSGSSNNGNLINVVAGNGAIVNLSQVSQITAGNTQFQASAGGQINLSALTTFSGAAPGGYNVLKAASEAANIVAPNLTSLTNVDLDLFGNATLPVAALTTFTNGNAYAYNDGLAGGVLTLPLTAINYAGANFSPLFQAEGAGSLLDLSSVTSWAGSGSSNNGNLINVVAGNGAIVNLSQLTEISGGNTQFHASVGGQILLSALTTFLGAAPGGYNRLDAQQGGLISLGSGPVTLVNVTIYVDATSTLSAGTFDLTAGSVLTGSGTITGNVINDGQLLLSQPTDMLVITGDYTQTLGTMTGQGSLTVNGLLTWAGGTITVSGPINANGGLSISGDTDKVLNGITINDGGSGTWTGLGNLILGNGAVLNLSSSASLDIQNDQAITNTLGGTATVNNAGFLDKSAGTGTTSIQVAFNNPGYLAVLSGTLSLTGAFGNFSGSTLTGGTYQVSGTLQFPGAAIVNNLAAILLDGPTAQIVDQAGNNALANFTSNLGSFTIQDGANFTAGDFNDAGSLTVGVGSTLTVNGTYTETGILTVLPTGILNAAGAFTNFSGGTLSGGTFVIGGTLQFVDAALVTNDATIVLESSVAQIVDESGNNALASFRTNDSAGSLTLLGGSSLTTAGDFSNAGSLSISFGSTLTVTGVFTHTGTLNLGDFGTLDLLGGGSANGTVSLGAASTLIVDTGSTFTFTMPVVLAGTVNVQTEATLVLMDGSSNTGSLNVAGTVLVSGSFANAGSVSLLNGSTFTVAGSYTQTDGSTALGNGTLSALGFVDLEGGVLSGSGTIAGSLQNAGIVDVGGSGAAGSLTITGNYTQAASGVLNFELGGYGPGTDYDQLAIGGTATLDGTLNVSLINDFVPMPGDSFAIVTFAALNGTFATTSLDMSLMNPPSYSATAVTVQA